MSQFSTPDAIPGDPRNHRVSFTIFPSGEKAEAVERFARDLREYGWSLRTSMRPGSPPPGHGPLIDIHLEGPSDSEALDLIADWADELGALADV